LAAKVVAVGVFVVVVVVAVAVTELASQGEVD